MTNDKIRKRAQQHAKNKSNQRSFVKGVRFMVAHLQKIAETMDGGEAIDEIIRMSELADDDFLEEFSDC